MDSKQSSLDKDNDIPKRILHINWKANVVSVAALVLSAGSIASQITQYWWAWLKGPEVELLAPRQIILSRFDLNKTGKSDFVRFYATMSYINLGEPTYDEVIMDESLELCLDGVLRKQNWIRFTSSAFEEGIPSGAQSTVGPTIIKAGNAEYHETLFFGRARACLERAEDCDVDKIRSKHFMKEFMHLKIPDAENTVSLVPVKISARTLREPKTLRQLCLAQFSGPILDQLMEAGWVALDCVQNFVLSPEVLQENVGTPVCELLKKTGLQ